jgi:hypothetical protein
MREIKAPFPFKDNYSVDERFLFLAGSIEMGKADNWQTKLVEALKDFPIVILNPRRDDWDSSWVQSIDNPMFREQVEWELDAMEFADGIYMYFDPNTKSPISLLELGLFAKEEKKLAVYCPKGFWRKGNVDVVCKRYGVKQFDTPDGIVKSIKEYYDNKNKQGSGGSSKDTDGSREADSVKTM